MRHNNKVKHLGKSPSHVKAMLSNMACSLIQHKRIITTLAKAKVLRRYIEPLITKSKNDVTHSRRIVFSYLQNKNAIKELFGVIAPAVMDRPGGYTRILKLGPRKSDSTEMALIELVDFNEYYQKSSASQEKKSTRRRRRKKTDSKSSQTTPDLTNNPSVVDTPSSTEESNEKPTE
jgi:large subunit ribosomal protein L17